jgi:hypothetical protein
MTSDTRDQLLAQSTKCKDVANIFAAEYEKLEQGIINAEYADENGGGGPIEPPPTGSARMLSQHGVTWTFDKVYKYGEFASGGFFLINNGPVKVQRNGIRGTGRDGSMLNPGAGGSKQGYDVNMRNTVYDGNVLKTDADSVMMNPGDTLVSAISHLEPGKRPQLKGASILTVLSTAPAEPVLRPSYCAGAPEKIGIIPMSQADLSLLLELTPALGMPSLSAIERYFERPWIDHVGNWVGRECHPSDNMPDYGRNMSSQVGIGALALHTSGIDKTKLLARYLQLGIDLWGIALNGGKDNWAANGGHASGRKWPMLFAKKVLGLSYLDMSGVAFGEDEQTFTVVQSDVGRTLVPVNGQTPVLYVQADVGLKEWGIVHKRQPQKDNRDIHAQYRTCCTANSWIGSALAARLMGMVDDWYWPHFFGYIDRYMGGYTDGLPGWMQSWHPWPKAMWGSYR